MNYVFAIFAEIDIHLRRRRHLVIWRTKYIPDRSTTCVCVGLSVIASKDWIVISVNHLFRVHISFPFNDKCKSDAWFFREHRRFDLLRSNWNQSCVRVVSIGESNYIAVMSSMIVDIEVLSLPQANAVHCVRLRRSEADGMASVKSVMRERMPRVYNYRVSATRIVSRLRDAVPLGCTISPFSQKPIFRLPRRLSSWECGCYLVSLATFTWDLFEIKMINRNTYGIHWMDATVCLWEAERREKEHIRRDLYIVIAWHAPCTTLPAARRPHSSSQICIYWSQRAVERCTRRPILFDGNLCVAGRFSFVFFLSPNKQCLCAICF